MYSLIDINAISGTVRHLIEHDNVGPSKGKNLPKRQVDSKVKCMLQTEKLIFLRINAMELMSDQRC